MLLLPALLLCAMSPSDSRPDGSHWSRWCYWPQGGRWSYRCDRRGRNTWAHGANRAAGL